MSDFGHYLYLLLCVAIHRPYLLRTVAIRYHLRSFIAICCTFVLFLIILGPHRCQPKAVFYDRRWVVHCLVAVHGPCMLKALSLKAFQSPCCYLLLVVAICCYLLPFVAIHRHTGC